MNRKITINIALLLCLSPSVWAHHSRSNFLVDSPVEFSATVGHFEYTNPHSHLYLERTNAQGEQEEWLAEMGSTPNLKSMQLSPDMLTPGTKVVFRGFPDRNLDRKFLLLDSITIDGVEHAFRVRRNVKEDFSAPGSSDLTGIWNRRYTPGKPSLGDAFFDKVDYPVTARGKAQLDKFNRDDDPHLNCEPHGVPRTIFAAYALVIKKDGSNNYHFINEYNEVHRVIHMDRKTHPIDGERTHLGDSIGWFEGDTLVIDTANFSPQKWGNGRGLDSSDQKHVVEHYRLTDNGHTIDASYTLTDPVYITEPVIISRMLRYSPDYEISEFKCNLEASRKYLDYKPKLE